MFRKILCTVDGSEAGQTALSVARDIAEKYQARITLIHVMPMPMLQLLAYRSPLGGADLLPQQVEDRLREEGDKILKQAKESLGDLVAEMRLELGHPGEVIAETAEVEEFGLVILGRRGMGALKRAVMGSVSSYVLSHCEVPVLVVREKLPTDPDT